MIFDAELDREFIELTHCERSVGTKITIRVAKEKQKEINKLFLKYGEHRKWDWYCLESPRLRRLNTDGEEIEPEFLFKETEEWNSVETRSMDHVAWAHKSVKSDQGYSRSKSRCLYVNGIFVQEQKDYGNDPSILGSLELSKGARVSIPTILLTDHNGQTDLNLQRDRLTKTDGKLSAALREGIARDLVAHALAFSPEQTPYAKSKPEKQKRPILSADFSLTRGERASYRTTDLRSPWCWEDGGWRLAEPTLALKKDRLLAIYGDYDLSFLDNNAGLLSNTSIFWVKSNASSKNTGDLTQALHAR